MSLWLCLWGLSWLYSGIDGDSGTTGDGGTVQGCSDSTLLSAAAAW